MWHFFPLNNFYWDPFDTFFTLWQQIVFKRKYFWSVWSLGVRVSELSLGTYLPGTWDIWNSYCCNQVSPCRKKLTRNFHFCFHSLCILIYASLSLWLWASSSISLCCTESTNKELETSTHMKSTNSFIYLYVAKISSLYLIHFLYPKLVWDWVLWSKTLLCLKSNIFMGVFDQDTLLGVNLTLAKQLLSFSQLVLYKESVMSWPWLAARCPTSSSINPIPSTGQRGNKIKTCWDKGSEISAPSPGALPNSLSSVTLFSHILTLSQLLVRSAFHHFLDMLWQRFYNIRFGQQQVHLGASWNWVWYTKAVSGVFSPETTLVAHPPAAKPCQKSQI